ncbi:MAG: hypothetical protein ACFCA4_13335 [Cyanophyceae cyanobacterium]
MFLFRRPTSLVKVTAIATLMLFTPMVVSAVASYQAFNELVRNELRLQRLSDRVAYLDEVLTMSARMNAATGDQQWEERYQVHVTELDNTIAKSIQLSPESYDDRDAARTEAANEKLVAIEKEAFRLVRTGRSSEALALLLSAEYSQKKAQYSAGVEARQGAIQNHIQGKIENYRKQLILSGGVAGVTLLGLIPAWFLVLRALRGRLKSLIYDASRLSKSRQEAM